MSGITPYESRITSDNLDSNASALALQILRDYRNAGLSSEERAAVYDLASKIALKDLERFKGMTISLRDAKTLIAGNMLAHWADITKNGADSIQQTFGVQMNTEVVERFRKRLAHNTGHTARRALGNGRKGVLQNFADITDPDNRAWVAFKSLFVGRRADPSA